VVAALAVVHLPDADLADLGGELQPVLGAGQGRQGLAALPFVGDEGGVVGQPLGQVGVVRARGGVEDGQGADAHAVRQADRRGGVEAPRRRVLGRVLARRARQVLDPDHLIVFDDLSCQDRRPAPQARRLAGDGEPDLGELGDLDNGHMRAGGVGHALGQPGDAHERRAQVLKVDVAHGGGAIARAGGLRLAFHIRCIPTPKLRRSLRRYA
jgi:hypothetical protein